MSRHLSDHDVAGAISQLTQAVAELATKTGQVPVRAELSDTEALEVERITLTHGRMFRPSPADLETSGSYEDEVLRLTSVSPDLFYSSSSRRRSAAARRQADSQTLALSRSTAEPAPGQLISRYGLPITYGGAPVMDTPQNRIAFGRVLAPMVVDVTDSPSTDVSSMVGRPTGGLGDDVTGLDDADARVPNARPTAAQIQAVLDQMRAQGNWDLGPDVSGFGKQTMEVSNPGALADPAAEVSRLVQAGAAAGVTGLRTGATKNRHPATGRFTSPQARLTGTLSGI